MITKNNKQLIVSLVIIVAPLFMNKYFSITNISIMGISFICFRGISYLVDCYNADILNNNILDYLLYMSFFATFLSGPIEKSDKFIKDINGDKKISWNDFVEAIIIICYGFIIKLIIADRISPIVNAIFINIGLYTKFTIFAILAYPVYIYCDFAGYSYIALGVSKLFGYNVTVNFKQPYFSLSIKEF